MIKNVCTFTQDSKITFDRLNGSQHNFTGQSNSKEKNPGLTARAPGSKLPEQKLLSKRQELEIIILSGEIIGNSKTASYTKEPLHC